MTTDNERKAFEAWASKAGWDEAFLAEYDAANNRYLNIPLNDMWFGWQAAKAEQDGWRDIPDTDDGDYPPDDTLVLLAKYWDLTGWEYKVDFYHCTKGGWTSQADKWKPLEFLPKPPKQGE